MDKSEARLDSTDRIAEIDKSGMLVSIEGFGRQVREAIEVGRSDVLLPSIEGIKTIAVLGMGGSGISGDVVASLVADSLPIPVITVKGYELPAAVDGGSLVFAVSYSGNTEETLECLIRAQERGARLVCISSDGRMEEIARDKGIGIFKVPGGFQPRASLGFLTVPILIVLERTGLVSGFAEELLLAADMLDERSLEYGVANPIEDNPAKRLAKDLVGYLPVVYGSEGTMEVAAKRWKTQFNENSKVPAFYNWFSELNHNETVGWKNQAEVCSLAHLIVIREREEHPRIARRIDITTDLLDDSVGHITQVWARGGSRTECLLDAIYLGDFTSFYLAIALGQDPTPVTRIESLKRRLAET